MTEKKLKICMITRTTLEHGFGGMENHTYNLINGLRDKGHKVWILTSEFSKKKKSDDKYLIQIPKTRNGNAFAFNRNLVPLFNYMNEKIHFDLVHAQSDWSNLLIEYFKGKLPFVITFHGLARSEGFLEKTRFSKFSLPLKIFLYFYMGLIPRLIATPPKFDEIIAVSYRTKWALDYDYPFLKEKITMTDEAIDTDKFKPQDKEYLKEKYGLKNNFIILFVGRMIIPKGPLDLLKIIPLLKDKIKNLKVIMIGTGPDLSKVKENAKKLNLGPYVEIKGRVSDEDLYNYYSLADIFINPSRIREAFGLVTAEAMCSGTLTIASVQASHKGIVKDGITAIKCDTTNSEKLAELVFNIYKDPGKYEYIRKEGITFINKTYSINNLIDRTVGVYRKALNSNFKKVSYFSKLLMPIRIFNISLYLIFHSFIWYILKPKLGLGFKSFINA